MVSSHFACWEPFAVLATLWLQKTGGKYQLCIKKCLLLVCMLDMYIWIKPFEFFSFSFLGIALLEDPMSSNGIHLTEA